MLLCLKTTKSSQLFYWRNYLQILKKNTVFYRNVNCSHNLKLILIANTIESKNKKTWPGCLLSQNIPVITESKKWSIARFVFWLCSGLHMKNLAKVKQLPSKQVLNIYCYVLVECCTENLEIFFFFFFYDRLYYFIAFDNPADPFHYIL